MFNADRSEGAFEYDAALKVEGSRYIFQEQPASIRLAGESQIDSD